MISINKNPILKSILENSQVIFFVLDTNYKYMLFSARHKNIMKNIWGIDIKVEDNILNIIGNQNDRTKAKRNFDRAISGEVFIIEEDYGDNLLYRTTWRNQYYPIEQDNKIIGIGVLVEDMSFILQTTKKYQDALFFKNVISLISNGVAIADATQSGCPTIFVNDYFTKLTGYEFNEVFGKSLSILQNHDRDQIGIKIMKDSIANLKSCEVELRNYKKDGTLFFNRVSLSPIFDENNQIKFYVGIQTDITEHQKYIEKLQKIFDLQSNILFVTDGHLPIRINKAFSLFYGVENIDEFKNLFGCICSTFEKDDKFFHLGKVKENENWLEAVMKLSEIDKKVSIKSARNIRHIFDIGVVKLDQKDFLVSLTDVSDTVLEKHTLENLVNFDNLTQAYTRTFFTNNIKRIIHEITIKKSLLIGIIMFDIDNFKRVNDTYGHDVGDKVLQNVVASAQKSIRQNDYLIRWGGEEFLIIAPVENIINLFNLADRIRLEIENLLTNNLLKITCSFGISICENLLIEKCIKSSDEALYKAKYNGKNRVEQN